MRKFKIFPENCPFPEFRLSRGRYVFFDRDKKCTCGRHSTCKTLMVPWLLAARRILESRLQHTLLTNCDVSSSVSSPCVRPPRPH